MKTLAVIVLIIPGNYFINIDPVLSQISVNEIMYAPADANNEWFEIYNWGNEAVNLQNWKWKDATSSLRIITSQNILLTSGSYIIICQDSVKFKLLYPEITGIIQQTVWSQLNNTGDNVILIAPDNSRVDSVTFLSTWGGSSGGYSLEKKISNGNPNSSSNWASSVSILRATPNKENSVTPKPFDLFLKSFSNQPLYPSVKDTLKMTFTIKNTGLNSAANFLLNIYADKNFDSTEQNTELIKSNQFELLNPDDTLVYIYSIANPDTGRKQFIAKIIYPADNDTINNKMIKAVYVSSFSNGTSGIVINEIMYEPFTGQSEWIEIYNSTSQSVNMKGWKYRESSSPVTLFSTDTFLNAGDYLLIAHDSTIYIPFPQLKNLQINQKIKFITNMSLSNSGEAISILDSLNNVISSIEYSPAWHNPHFPETKGISLERINPAFSNNETGYWSSCTKPEGGTPGNVNSIFTVNKSSESEVSVSPNPFSPDGDGFEDFTIIKYRLKYDFAQMKIRIFDIKGRLVKTLANNSVSGKESSVIYNGLDDGNNRLRIGIYILLIEAIDDKGGTVDIQKVPFVIAVKL